jgi:chromosomal replication initiation ATPase DnaA
MNTQEEAITQIVEKVSGIDRKQIRSRIRIKEYAVPRSILGYMLRADAGCTYKRAGELVGRDHASVLKYYKDHDNNFRYYQDYKIMYREIKREYLKIFKNVEFEVLQKQIKDLQVQLDELIEEQNRVTSEL